jgi:hypothetical protein
MKTLRNLELKVGDVLLFKESPYFLYWLYKFITRSKYQNCAIVYDFKYGQWWTIEVGGLKEYSELRALPYIIEKYKKFDIARNSQFIYFFEKRMKNSASIILGKSFSINMYLNILINKTIEKYFNKYHKTKRYFNLDDGWIGSSLTSYILSFLSNIQMTQHYEFIDSDYFVNNIDWEIYGYNDKS